MDNFKILIADDEYWTREKLRRMIDWSSYGLTLLEPAEDGEEVLRRMEQERVDILITDINMPFLNGVDLLREVQNKYPDTIPFVISGYDDFDYVKDSFMAGSINYLMKPVSRIDLVNAIIRALDIVAKRNSEREEFLKASSLIQDREFSQLLEQREMALTPDITMNSKVDFTGAKLLLIKIHDMGEIAKTYAYDMNLLSFKLKEKIRELVKMEDVVIFNHTYRSNEFILMSEAESRLLVTRAHEIKVELEKITASPVSIVLNENTCSMDNIYQAYVQAVARLMTRSYTKESVVLCAKEAKNGEDSVNNRITEAQLQELRTLWKSGNSKAIRQMLFEQIGMKHCDSQKWQYLEVKQTLRRIVNTWEEYMAGRSESYKSVEYENMVEAADKEVEKLDAVYVCDLLDDMIEMAADAATDSFVENTGQIIKQVAAYIDEYYYEPLTLSGLAEKYHMENSYFSRSFRKEIGENLIHYISRTRIEKAKEHMRSGDTNLAEIAFMVGYDDYTYFNKVFRKMVGVGPREYRQSMKGV
ncbi:MAG: response regulator [Lachnospiraceae bacterium]|nr:response regulator [Lachnospiraceae bacterium]